MKKLLWLCILTTPIFLHAQNVGIGTPTPTGKLQINHRSASGFGIRLVDSTNNSAGSIEFRNLARTKWMLASSFSGSDYSKDQYIDINGDSAFIATFRGNGFTGFRNLSPQYPVDVFGDINTTGALRVNGDAGNTNQFLRSNGDGTMGWQDIFRFDNLANYRTTGAHTFIVPAGVTRVMVEVWGAGGGGTAYAGGGGGGYVCGFMDVTPSSTVNITVGTGGTGDHDNASSGGSSNVTYGPTQFFGLGGGGATLSGVTVGGGGGGTFSAGGTINFYGIAGQAGSRGVNNFMQVNATTFYEFISGANGGDAGNSQNAGGKGAFAVINVASGSLIRSGFTSVCRQPGGGGGGGYYSGPGNFSNGDNGANGVVIIHY